MKLTKLWRLIETELDNTTMDLSGGKPVDPEVSAESEVLILMNQLGQNAEFIQALRAVELPEAKYKAILSFADLLGIPQDKFHSTIEQYRIQLQQDEQTPEY